MPGTSGLPLAGVEAIVEGLSSFQGDIRSMNSALDSLRPRTTTLQNLFTGAWEAVKDFGREILNVAEYALGHLLADAIQGIISKIGELISATIEAGAEFQTLELRLQGINFDAALKSGGDMATAQREAIRLTQEQLEWLQKLAATTPYDNTDISNVYTLARSYGFADDAARQLTRNTVNFASSMGLSGEVLERVIMNMGQMVQRGKITSTEMRDLARGAFVPLSDILERIATKTGKSVTEVMKEISKPGGGLPAQLFIDAFNEMIEQEPRFIGAAERMAKTFKASSDNAQDIVKSIGGLNVVKPILDAIAERIAGFTSAFTDDPKMWNRLVDAAKRLGAALAEIVRGVFDLLPSSQSLADAVVSAVEKLASWIETNKGGIIEFFKGIWTWIQDNIIPALQRFFAWLSANWPLIMEFFSALWNIVGQVFDSLTGGLQNAAKETDFLDLITKVMQFIVDHQEAIARWVEILLKAWLAWQVLATIWNVVINALISVIGFVLGLVAVWSALSAAVSFLGPILAGIATFITGTLIPAIAAIAVPVLAVIAVLVWLAAIVSLVYLAFKNNWFGIRDIWNSGVQFLKEKMAEFGNWLRGIFDHIVGVVSEKLNHIISVIRNKWGEWESAGRDMINGFIQGVIGAMGGLISSVVNAVQSAYNAARSVLKSKSPSKLFEDLGEFTMEGFAQGIEKAAGMAVGAMQGAMSAVAVPAVSSMAAARAAGSTYNNERNFNLTVNSSAPTEPIIADFNMMESLIGA